MFFLFPLSLSLSLLSLSLSFSFSFYSVYSVSCDSSWDTKRINLASFKWNPYFKAHPVFHSALLLLLRSSYRKCCFSFSVPFLLSSTHTKQPKSPGFILFFYRRRVIRIKCCKMQPLSSELRDAVLTTFACAILSAVPFLSLSLSIFRHRDRE